MKKQIIKFTIVAGVIVGGAIIWKLPMTKKLTRVLESKTIHMLVGRYASRHNLDWATFCSVADDMCSMDNMKVIATDLEKHLVKLVRT